MANQKKFTNPAIIQMRVEKEIKDYIIENYGNITEFINKAISDRLETEMNGFRNLTRIESVVLAETIYGNPYGVYGQGNFDLSCGEFANLIFIASKEDGFEGAASYYKTLSSKMGL